LDRSELLTLIKQMIQRPDLALLVNASPDTHEEQPRAPLDPEQYRLKIEVIFATTDRTTWGSESRAAGPLLDIMQVQIGSWPHIHSPANQRQKKTDGTEASKATKLVMGPP